MSRKGRFIVIARHQRVFFVAGLLLALAGRPAAAQTKPSEQPAKASEPSGKGATSSPATPPVVTGGVPFLPADYVVGPEDVLGVVFWRERDLSADVIVRPDGRISLPLLNDVDVAGLTPEQVRERLQDEAKKFIEEPNATVVVKQINSRKVYITGNVERPGVFPLLRPTTILQLIALAGGPREFAKSSEISVVRLEGEKQSSYRFNYDDVKTGRNLAQNILLKPGDTVIVP